MNAGKIIKLTDGTTIEAKMNFGTIFYLDQIGGSKLGRRIDKLEKIGKATDSDKMNFAAKLIYAMVRSNGRKVTFDEALQLVPPDPTELLEVVEGYQKEVDKIKKRGIESTDESIQLEINWAEYMVDAREMGMTEDEFFHSCPVFFANNTRYSVRRKRGR